jgi:DnaJ-class molecular chaperone
MEKENKKPCPVCKGRGFLDSTRFRFRPVCQNCRGSGSMPLSPLMSKKIFDYRFLGDFFIAKRTKK